jgi:hypothetical protein
VKQSKSADGLITLAWLAWAIWWVFLARKPPRGLEP